MAAAAVIDDQGRLLYPSDSPAQARDALDRLWATADRAAGSLADRPLEQLVVDTPDGCVLAVRDGGYRMIAVTAPHPSVGRLLYDMRRCLMALPAHPRRPAHRKDAA